MAVCKVLTSEEELAEIAEAWRNLQTEVGLSPFTAYNWAMAWWDAIGRPSGAKLMVVACFEKDELMGLIPFSIRKKYGVRVLRLLGHEVYYYRNFLVKEPSLMPFIWQTVLEQKGYDFANIKNIHKETEEDLFFETRAKRVSASEVYYSGDLGAQRDEFMERYSKSFRRKIRRTQTLVQSTYGLEVDYCRGEPVPEDVIDFMIRRKKAWTKERNKRGIFDEMDPASLYKEIVKISAREGKILLYWMRLDGEVVGVTLSMIEKGTLYGHTLAFDHKASRYAPGIFLSMESLLWATENGLSENNFMEGEEEYKTRFGKTSRTIHEYIFVRTFFGWCYDFMYAVLRTVRSIRQKFLDRN